MFCPNCGEKLESPNQSFCASCGSELHPTPIPEVSQELPVENQVTTPVNTIQVSEVVPIKKGGPGSYSKKTFAFAFLSLVIAFVGFGLEFIAFIKFMSPIYVFPRFPNGPILLIAALVVHLVGVIFGIVSRSNCKKAKIHEMENALEKVGNVFGILGLIANIIPIVAINIMIVFRPIPLSFPSLPD